MNDNQSNGEKNEPKTANNLITNSHRFSTEAGSYAHYTPCVYALTKEETEKCGILSIGGYCRCVDKTTCCCLEKMKKGISEKCANIK